MSEFAGLIQLDGRAIVIASAQRLARAIQGVGRPARWQPEPWALFLEARGANDPVPGQPANGAVVLADAWFEAPAEAARALGFAHVPRDRDLAAAACAAWGPGVTADRLAGGLALAHWDGPLRRLTLARDAFGQRPIYYVEASGSLLFATSLQVMLAMPETPRDLDEMALADALTRAMGDPERTVYRYIRRAPPGGLVVFEKGRCTVSRWYSRAHIPTIRLRHDDDYVEAGRERLDAAVASRLPPDGLCATTLSGGLDSAGVTATAAQLLGQRRLSVFTRLGAREHRAIDPDEGRLAELLVARHSNIDWHVVDRIDPRVSPFDPEGDARLRLVPRIAALNGEWFESLYLAISQAQPARLLSGGAGNYTLSYDGRDDAVGALREGRLRDACREVAAAAGRKNQSLPRALASALFQGIAPRALRRWRLHQQDGEAPWLRYAPLSRDFLGALDYEEHARASGHDIPFSQSHDSVTWRLRILQLQGAVDNRGLARRRWPFETLDPYRDRRLVEFCLGIPDDQHRREGRGRWLARRVLADRVPAETLERTARGRQAPEWFALPPGRREQMADAIDRIARSPVASRVLDVPRMRALLDEWPRDAASAEGRRVRTGSALHRGIAMGAFLRWHEGRND